MRPDGRRAICPLCGLTTCTGSLRSHVASTRCLAQAARRGVVFSAAQRALMAAATALDAQINGAGHG